MASNGKQVTVTREMLTFLHLIRGGLMLSLKKRKIHIWILSDLKIQPWIFLKKRPLMATRILLRAIFISHVLTFF